MWQMFDFQIVFECKKKVVLVEIPKFQLNNQSYEITSVYTVSCKSNPIC